MTELLYTTAKCKKMADEHNHFILSTRACGTGPVSTHSTCVGTERVSGVQAGSGACTGGGARPVREVGEALSAGARGTLRGHTREARWMARSVDSLVGLTFGSR
jgi:hypothetical protein